MPMPKKEIVRVEKMAATNPNLSLATRFGNLVFVAGETRRDPATRAPRRGNPGAERHGLRRLKGVLAAAGAPLGNVLTVTTHLTKREDLAPYNEEYGRYFPDNKPARTTVEVMLNSPELLVEITVTACVPE